MLKINGIIHVPAEQPVPDQRLCESNDLKMPKSTYMTAGEDDEIRLAENLKYLNKTMSLRKLAKSSGVPHSSLSSWCHGQLPSGAAGNRNLRRLCRFLGVSWEKIMYGDLSKQDTAAQPASLNDVFSGGAIQGRFLVDIKIKRVNDTEEF